MKRKNSLLILSVLLVFFVFSITSCNQAQKEIFERLRSTEAGDLENEEIDTQRVKELEAHVRKFSDEVETLVRDTGKLGIYYRMLAVEYFNQEMFGPALENLLKALDIYPNNHILHYYTGLAQAQLSGAAPDEEGRREILNEAVFHHQRAIELRPDYFNAHYALSVLYLFELDRPLQAEEYVLRALDLKANDTNSLFLLARIRVIQNRVEEAVEIYDTIISETKDPEAEQRARENRDQLLRGRP